MSDTFKYGEEYIYVEQMHPRYRVKRGGIKRLMKGSKGRALNIILTEHLKNQDFLEVDEDEWTKLLLLVAANKAYIYKIKLTY